MHQLESYFSMRNQPAPETRVELVEAIRQDHASRMGTYLGPQAAMYLSQEERRDMAIHHVKDPEKQLRW